MKNLLLICLLGSIGLINKSYSQVTITYAADSTGGLCVDSSYTIGFYFTAEMVGYTISDVPTIYIDFGDGNDTTFLCDNFDGNTCWFAIPYYYSNNGVYDVTYIITMPDMQADTLVH